MRIGFAGVWLRVVVAMLLGVSCGLPMAGQAVPTTNEVRAMRGLGPIGEQQVSVPSARGELAS